MNSIVNNVNIERQEANRRQFLNWENLSVFKSPDFKNNSITFSKRGKAVTFDRPEAKKLCNALNIFLRRNQTTEEEDSLDSPFSKIQESCNVWWSLKHQSIFSQVTRGQQGDITIGKWDGKLSIPSEHVMFFLKSLLDCFVLMSWQITQDLEQLRTRLQCLALQVSQEHSNITTLDRTSTSVSQPEQVYLFFCERKRRPCPFLCQACETIGQFTDVWSKRASLRYTYVNRERIGHYYRKNQAVEQFPMTVGNKGRRQDDQICCYQFVTITNDNQKRIVLNKDQVLICIYKMLDICEWKKSILIKHEVKHILKTFEAAMKSKFLEVLV